MIAAALELARAGGPAAVGLRAVSREAGVSHSAAYRHFADHGDLLAAVSDRCMDELARLMLRRMDDVAVDGLVSRAWAKLEAIGRAYIEFALTEPGWFRTAFSGATHDGPAADQASRGGDLPNPFELLGARLDELVAVGAVPAERRPGAEHAAWSMVHGLSSLLVDGPLRGLPPPDVDGAIATVLAVVERGL